MPWLWLTVAHVSVRLRWFVLLRILQLPFLWGLATLLFCEICSHDSVGTLMSLSEALWVSLYRFFWMPWERFPTSSSPWRIFVGKCSSGILLTWPGHLNCTNFRRVCTFCIPALFGTSMSGILSCYLIFRSVLRQVVWKLFSLWACRW